MLHSLRPAPWAILTTSRLCSVRLLAIGKVAAARSVKCSSGPADASFAIRRLVEESIGAKSETQPSSQASRDYPVPQRATDDKETLSTPRKKILDSLTSFVHETQHAFMSEDLSLHRHLAQIYRELDEQRMQIRQLKLAIEQPREPKDKRIMMASNCSMHVPGKLVDPVSEYDTAEDLDSSAVDIFFDCVSRFSMDDSSSSIDRFHANFSGSPEYRFESNFSFYPEQYTTEGLFNERVFVIAMMQSQEDQRTLKYFLTYAETPRRWQRIIMSATFNDVQEQSAILQIWAPDNSEFVCKVLPNALQSLLKTLLPRLNLFNSVTSLSMSLREGESGQIIVDSPRIEVIEDDLETEMSDENQILQDIEDMDCKQYVESNVIVRSRITSSCYFAWVDSRICVEQKVPFASAGREGENGFHDFFNDLKLLNSLRGCTGVVQFIGVVLDDTRLHLRSYLYESPMITSIEKLLGIANSRSEKIPWPIRETWARQIIKAILDVHNQGLVVGVLRINSVGVRADGTAVLRHLKTSQRHLRNEKGEMPPELRNTSKSDDRALWKTMNFRTDIFQLGLFLWLLAEHKPKVLGHLCTKSACTKLPRYMCTADHANPVELPACCDSIPSYFNDIIRECRSPDPKARPSARKLAEVLQYTGNFEDCPPGMNELLDTYSTFADYFSVYCDECGMLTTDVHYHCNICYLGNFDLCQTCFDEGIHCFIPEHRLVKRIMRNGSIVNES
jgi:hypothetical protein